MVISDQAGKEGAELVRGERGGEGAGQIEGVKGLCRTSCNQLRSGFSSTTSSGFYQPPGSNNCK